jgi:hypothetical protein
MPRKILSEAKRDLILSDLFFAHKMLNTKKLTADDLSAVIRHLDMARTELVAAVSGVQKRH